VGSPTEPRFAVAAVPAGADGVVVAAAGELHMSTAPALGAHLRAAVRDGASRLVIDLSAVQFIDSTGLGVLLNASREIARAGGELALVCSNPTVLRLFTITGTDATLAIHATRDAALRAVGAAQPHGCS
jgi:anti-sigma B factor antagonist